MVAIPGTRFWSGEMFDTTSFHLLSQKQLYEDLLLSVFTFVIESLVFIVCLPLNAICFLLHCEFNWANILRGLDWNIHSYKKCHLWLFLLPSWLWPVAGYLVWNPLSEQLESPVQSCPKKSCSVSVLRLKELNSKLCQKARNVVLPVD